ncbi:MAG: hypoxanthine phosphoribosyltransferase [Nanoarchaeota archaeon]
MAFKTIDITSRGIITEFSQREDWNYVDHRLKGILIPESELQDQIKKLGEEITHAYMGRQLKIVPILQGAWMFSSDLLRHVHADIMIDFLEIGSYDRTVSTGKPRISKDLKYPVEGEHVLMIEDIVDTGHTLEFLFNYFNSKGAKTIDIACLLNKPSRRKEGFTCPIKYRGFDVPNEFVIGYGLDYEGHYRNLPFLGVLDETKLDKK